MLADPGWLTSMASLMLHLHMKDLRAELRSRKPLTPPSLSRW
jgi:hypothetical protein